MNERVKSASLYAAGDRRYSGRNGPPPPPPPGSTTPSDATPAGVGRQRPRVRVRRVATSASATRYEMPSRATYTDDAVVMPAADEFHNAMDDELQLDDELKMEFDRSLMAHHRRPQRIKYVKCKTRVQPDLLVPYLYGGDRRSRIHEIMERTGCTIDYCPESPDDQDDDMAMDDEHSHSRGQYMMNFLITAETAAQLETATRLLRVLVDRVQVHVGNKLTAAAAAAAAAARRAPATRRGEHEGSPLRSRGHREQLERRHSIDVYSPRYPTMLKTEPQGGANDYETIQGKPVQAATGRHAAAAGSTQSMAADGNVAMPRPRTTERWVDNEDYAAWPTQAHMAEDVSQHYWSNRQYGAPPRVHRPVYRRILVDEDGYEVVYPPPHYDHLRRLSPRLSASSAAMASSPPLRRHRPRDAATHYRQETSSSDGESGGHVRSEAGVPIRLPSRAAPRPAATGIDNVARTRGDMIRDDGIEFSSRRGLKRRLEPHRSEDVHHPHYRMSRRGPPVYEYLSEGDDGDAMLLSGDEYVDDMDDEDTSSWHSGGRARGTSPPTSDSSDGQRTASEPKDGDDTAERVEHGAHERDELERHGLDAVHSSRLDDVDSFGHGKSSPELEVKSPGSSASATPEVVANGSIAFENSMPPPSADQAVAGHASDAESETATAGAVVMPHGGRVAQASTKNAEQEEPEAQCEEIVRGIEPVGDVAVLPADISMSDVHDHLTTQVEEVTNDGAVSTETGLECDEARVEDAVQATDETNDAPSSGSPSPDAVQPLAPRLQIRLIARVGLNDTMKAHLDANSESDAARTRVESNLLTVTKRAAALALQTASHQQLRELARVAQDVECEIWRQHSVTLEAKQSLSATLEVAIQQASDQSKPACDRVAALQAGLENVISLEMVRLRKALPPQPVVPVARSTTVRVEPTPPPPPASKTQKPAMVSAVPSAPVVLPVEPQPTDQQSHSHASEAPRSKVPPPVRSAVSTPVRSSVSTPARSTVSTPVRSTVSTSARSAVSTPSCSTPVRSAVSTPARSAISTPVRSAAPAPARSSVSTIKGTISSKEATKATLSASTIQTPRIVADTLKPASEVSKRDSSAVARLSIPREAPSFVSGLVLELERSTGLSTVMASAQKRLLREISKSDPYYYLHSMQLLDAPRKGRASSACPFGCSGVSAQKWERKVVSQISSRMKWFDSVAYSLAKVSGGKELLSRKKLNSTVRKLHLVALQLHCLIGHLYCLRKRTVCREIDSLPTALNNSYYEKRMNGYKSRLKLTVHQPPSPLHATGTGGLPAPPDELLRDTFEFYPELLLCVDVWGYDDRQGTKMTPASKTKVPSELFRKVSQLAFDFETDANGLLQSICEELLSILCQWNDFKWGESLESLTIDDIVAFEAKVKASIRKILDAHATHLLAQWSALLLHKPLTLKHVRLTQANVYYSEQPTSSITSMPVVTTDATNAKTNPLFRRDDDEDDDEEDDDEEMNEDEEEDDTMVHQFWRTRFPPSSSLSSSSSSSSSWASSKATKQKGKDALPPLNLDPLREEEMLQSKRETDASSFKWGDVYDMRQRCLALSGATARLQTDNNNSSDESKESDVGDLLRRLAQARSVVEEAIRTSEQLAIHSLNHQRSDEGRETRVSRSADDRVTAMDECMSDASRDDDDDALVDALLSSTKSSAEKPRRPNENAATTQQPMTTKQPMTTTTTTSGDTDSNNNAWTQPVMKDLLEIVASTNHEINDICGQRARSARVRDKLQSQSLDLARQSIQIFQTILNMKP